MLTNNKVVGKVANIKERNKVGIIKGLALAKLWEGRNQGAVKNMSGTTRPGSAVFLRGHLESLKQWVPLPP